MKIAVQKRTTYNCSDLCENWYFDQNPQCKKGFEDHDEYGLMRPGEHCPLYHHKEYEVIEKDFEIEENK